MRFGSFEEFVYFNPEDAASRMTTPQFRRRPYSKVLPPTPTSDSDSLEAESISSSDSVPTTPPSGGQEGSSPTSPPPPPSPNSGSGSGSPPTSPPVPGGWRGPAVPRPRPASRLPFANWFTLQNVVGLCAGRPKPTVGVKPIRKEHGSGWLAWLTWTTGRRRVRPEAQALVESHIAADYDVDEDVEDLHDEVLVVTPQGSVPVTTDTGKGKGVARRKRRAGRKAEIEDKLIFEARADFPLAQTKRTDANELALSRFFAARLTELGYTRSSVGAHVPILVASYFIPREIDIIAADMLKTKIASQQVAERDAAVDHTVWDRFWRPWGRRDAVPKLRD